MRRYTRQLAAGLAVLAIVWLRPSLGLAQNNCVKFITVPPYASINLAGSKGLSAASPASFCTLNPDETYKMSIRSAGYELRYGKLRWDSSAGRAKFGSYQYSHTLYSAIVPGSGQIAIGHGWAGLWSLTLNTIAIVDLVNTYQDWDNAYQASETLSALAAAAPTVGLKEQLNLQALGAAQQANTELDHFYDMAAVTLWIYTWNLVETAIWTAAPSIKASDAGDGSYQVKTPRISKSRALLQSLIYPGMGQRYLGRTTTGYLFQVAFLTGLVITTRQRKDYWEAEDDYEFALAELEMANTVDEIDEAWDNVNSAWDELQSKDKYLTEAYVYLGTVYGLNLLSVLLSTNRETQPKNPDFQTSYRNGRIEMGWAFRF